MDELGVERFHVVSAKVGGTVARAFAARRPERVRTLTVVGSPTPLRLGRTSANFRPGREFERRGHRGLVRARSIAGLSPGSAFPPRGAIGGPQSIGRTAVSTRLWFHGENCLCRHPGGPVQKIRLPHAGHHHRGQCRSPQSTPPEPGRRRLPDSELLVLPGDSTMSRRATPTAAPRRPLNSSSTEIPRHYRDAQLTVSAVPLQSLLRLRRRNSRSRRAPAADRRAAIAATRSLLGRVRTGRR